MKKALLLLSIVTLLVACKKEDVSSKDPIIGKWYLTHYKPNGGEKKKIPECPVKVYYEFLESGVWNSISLESDDESDGCPSGKKLTGTWKFKSKGVYTLTINIGKESNSADINMAFNGNELSFRPGKEASSVLFFTKK